MLINAQAVKNNRVTRNWTQQQLADACAVSIRTIQRVERYGNASLETSLALHAVFELVANSLVLTEQLPEPRSQQDVMQMPCVNRSRDLKLIITAVCIGLILGVLLARFYND